MAKYLDINIGDDVSIYVDWGKTKEMSQVKSPKAHLFAMLTAGIHNVTIDFDREFIVSNGLGIPFDLLGLNSEPTYNATYTIKNTYEAASGKFSEAYGSVVLIDCDYVLEQIIDELYVDLDHYRSQISWVAYEELFGLLYTIQQKIKTQGITLCNLAFNIIGVLNDQSSYYID